MRPESQAETFNKEGRMATDSFFSEITEPIRFGGIGSTDPLSFRVYQPDRLVLGKRMEDHLRVGVCFWHSFAWDGTDMFGLGTMDRPWITEPMDEGAQGPPRLPTCVAVIRRGWSGHGMHAVHERGAGGQRTAPPTRLRRPRIPRRPARGAHRCAGPRDPRIRR
jgi:hypothetical protein